MFILLGHKVKVIALNGVKGKSSGYIMSSSRSLFLFIEYRFLHLSTDGLKSLKRRR